MDFAKRVEAAARARKVSLLVRSFDASLKLPTRTVDFYASELFEELQASGIRLSEGLCDALLSRSAEMKFLRLAEEIVHFMRACGSMTISVYST